HPPSWWTASSSGGTTGWMTLLPGRGESGLRPSVRGRNGGHARSPELCGEGRRLRGRRGGDLVPHHRRWLLASQEPARYGREAALRGGLAGLPRPGGGRVLGLPWPWGTLPGLRRAGHRGGARLVGARLRPPGRPARCGDHRLRPAGGGVRGPPPHPPPPPPAIPPPPATPAPP